MSALQGYEQEPLVPFEEAVQPLISIVPGIEQMVEVVKEKIDQSPYYLSTDELASIMIYTLRWKTPQSSFYFILNETLRSQIRKQLLPWFPYLRLFISALSKLPSISSCTVYRGLKMNVNEEYSKDDVVIWWDFVSCTSSMEFPEDLIDDNERKTMFIIECEFAKDISEYSFDGNRKQILLYPGRQFRVISSLNYGDQSKFIQLKEIRQSSPVIQIPKTASNRNYPMNRLESIIDQKSLNSIIDLNDQELTDKGMTTIVKDAIGTKQCVKLLLSNNKFTSNGSSVLAKALDNNATLKFLNLSYNNLSDEGVQYLTEILSRNNSKLEVLSLHRTGITDQCAPYLVKMLKKNTTLTWLHLGRNKISDQSMRHLTEVLIDHNKTLKVLDLSHNKSITDSSIDYLIEMLKSNTSLETLWINNCKISNQEKKRLQKFVESRRRFFLLFVDDVPDHILKLSEKLTNNRRQ